MGLFSEWQPRYAAHGISTFPVKPDKKPAIKGYLKIGTDTSGQLALKFGANDAFGLACKRNRITVLDVDTPDERVLADGLDRYGSTPFIVRSGSGNFQAWFRNNGEGRRVRPNPAKPIDILGDGYVVAPPSIGAKGAYSLIRGSLDDLNDLPVMQAAEEHKPLSGESAEPAQSHTAGEARNQTLWRECMKMARGCINLEELMEKAMAYNQTAFYEPLSAEEVLKVIASAWGYEVGGKNWFGHGARLVMNHSIVDDLAIKEPRAFILLSLLMRNHWGRDFVITKAWAETIDWSVNTLREARDVLLRLGLIKCIHEGGRGANDPSVYRFCEGVKN